MSHRFHVVALAVAIIAFTSFVVAQQRPPMSSYFLSGTDIVNYNGAYVYGSWSNFSIFPAATTYVGDSSNLIFVPIDDRGGGALLYASRNGDAVRGFPVHGYPYRGEGAAAPPVQMPAARPGR